MKTYNCAIRSLTHTETGRILALVVALGWSFSAHAEPPAWQCEGAPVIEHNNVIALDFTEQASIGERVDTTFNTGQGGVGNCNCPESGSYTSYFTSTTGLTVTSDGWLKLNDNIDARLRIFVLGSNNVLVPFSKVPNTASSPCSPENGIVNASTGSRGQVAFRITKPFVGEIIYSGRLATMYWQINDSSAAVDMNYPYAHVNADIRLKVLASCQFRAGDTFTIDLGDIDKAALTEGGLPKYGFTPKSIDLSLDCVNIGSSGKVSYMFQSASGSEGNLLLTDLRGLGIGLHDGDDNPVGLGAENAIEVPVVSDTTSFLLKPYPSKLPGAAVESGSYTAQAIVTVTLP
ncbi:fimbrial protein [Pseudomonas segetis]|nr:fimbrial protein [Pseudomonas segetis]